MSSTRESKSNNVREEIKSQLLTAFKSKSAAVASSSSSSSSSLLPVHDSPEQPNLDSASEEISQLRPRAPSHPISKLLSQDDSDTDLSDVDDNRPITIRIRTLVRPILHPNTAESMTYSIPQEVDQYSDQPIQLPPNWTQYYDETHQHYYYFHEITGESRWEPPSIPCWDEQKQPSKKGTSPKHGKKDKEESPKNGKKEKDKEKKKGNKKKLSSHSSMPSHMLLDISTSSDAPGIDEHPSRNPSPQSFFDVNACYSDMDEGGEDTGPYTMPTFTIPEDRLWGEFPKGRTERLPLIGGTNQDYLNMARSYKSERLYSDPNHTQTCVLCKKRKANYVLFPCEHRCLCNVCIDKEEICADTKMSTKTHGHCNCPLCAAVIKKILVFEGGAEIEKYWSWVYEFPPPLPDKFMQRWKHSAKVIRKVFIEGGGQTMQSEPDDDDENSVESESSRSCVIS